MAVAATACVALGIAACGGRSDLGGPASDAGAADPPPRACGPATCAGCCDDAGACQPGTAESQCGAGGGACQACDPRYDVCNPRGGGPDVTDVVCWAPCPLRECAGCCTLDGECVGGAADDACGGPQRVCQDCASRAMVCGAVEDARGCIAP